MGEQRKIAQKALQQEIDLINAEHKRPSEKPKPSSTRSNSENKKSLKLLSSELLKNEPVIYKLRRMPYELKGMKRPLNENTEENFGRNRLKRWLWRPKCRRPEKSRSALKGI